MNMADKNVDEPGEYFAPPASLILDMCQSIAAAQRKLDEESLAAQREIVNEKGDLYRLGYRANWYQIPEAIIELKMSVHMGKTTEGKDGLFIRLLGTQNKTSQSYTAETSSTLRLRIVPVPPPASTNVPE
jgi:hypothetical protein